jgi:hypothetical protein
VSTPDDAPNIACTIPIASRRCWILEVCATAYHVASNTSSAFVLLVAVKRGTGAASIVGAPVSLLAVTDAGGAVDVSASGSDVVVEVTGELATSLAWEVSVFRKAGS